MATWIYKFVPLSALAALPAELLEGVGVFHPGIAGCPKLPESPGAPHGQTNVDWTL